ncbi:dihydroxyacetone kinase subunit DhaL [Amphibacillus sediminis]|uniref:dihydroxyacetone kinase subunit DhaL n=1 Tax=Amphibacillus sediminis TaxID=360185 RepID=UPI000829F2C0|nr:dihydroxyacetone kinase subunit DhaL [Amphibacillus sediminis]
MCNQLTIQQVKDMLLHIADVLIQKEDELGEIDRHIGDGDHGTGMATGARAIQKELKEQESTSVNQVFRQSGIAMMESMGGASGVLFSSLFLALGKIEPEAPEIDVASFSDGVSQAVKDIKIRGRAGLGDKTMLDALEPASVALIENKNSTFVEALAAAKSAAQQGVENTKGYVAKFGRAKFLGERSLGYQDPGATSIAMIINEMYQFVKEEFK